MAVGIFAEWQPQYQRRGIITFPVRIVGNDKIPAVKGYAKIGPRLSQRYALEFADAEAFGVSLDRHNLDILDIDVPSDKALADGLARHGATPLKIRTQSGKFHAVYARRPGSDRRRLIRPKGGLPGVDYLLGKGLWVCPPSVSHRGRYEIIEGSLDDLSNLPMMKGLDAFDREEKVGTPRVGQGARRGALRDFLRPQARFCDTVDDLIDVAFGFANERMDRHDGHEFSDAEVRKEARSIWKWTEDGNNFAGVGRSLVLRHDIIDRVMQLGADAFFLYVKLRRHNWEDQSFPIANAMTKSMGGGSWTLRRLQRARQSLIDAKMISPVRDASSFKGAALFGWVSDNAPL